MKNLIYAGVGVVVLAGVAYFIHESNEQKEMEDFVNTTETTSQNTIATSTEVSATSSTTDTAADSSPKKFTMSEIAKHNSKSDCWLVINGTVLDVTSFIDKHPGGDKILKGCGVDATGYFNKVPGHMKGIAQTLLNKMKIGDLE